MNSTPPEALEALRYLAQASDDLQITVMADRYELHWKTLVVKTDSAKSAIKAIKAFSVLETIGAEDF